MHARRLSVLIVVLLTFSLISAPVSADTVIRSETVDLLPAGTFDDASEWSLSTNKAYSSDPAEYSQSMVADGRLSHTIDLPISTNLVHGHQYLLQGTTFQSVIQIVSNLYLTPFVTMIWTVIQMVVFRGQKAPSSNCQVLI